MTKKKAKEYHKPVGRPSKLKTINLVHLKFLIEKGCTDEEICGFFKIDRSTFWKYQKDIPEFSNAIKDWKKYADERVERSLYERACGYKHQSEEIFCAFGKVTRVKTIKEYAPDPISCFFWLKNRKPKDWRDKVEEQGDDDLKDAELSFTGVPMKSGKLPEAMTRFHQNN